MYNRKLSLNKEKTADTFSNYVGVICLLLTFICLFGSRHVAAAELPICNQEDGGNFRQPMTADPRIYQGKRLLVLAGGFELGSAEAVTPSIRKGNYEEVWMCSPGGYVHEGIKIGKELNRARATVRTPRGFRCVSACTIAFMGGYVRIIGRDAHFDIHASSRYSGFGLETYVDHDKRTKYRFGVLLYDYFSKWRRTTCEKLDRLCMTIRAEIQSMGLSKHECPELNDVFVGYNNPSQLYKNYCSYFDDGNEFAYNFTALALGRNNSNLVSMFSLFAIRSGVTSELNLLKYYQEMLLDGRKNLIRERGYNQIKLDFNPVNVYDKSPSNVYARNLVSDMQSFRVVRNWSDSFAIWQVMLTDSELSLKNQIVEYIKASNINLGAAGKDALKVYDAMRTCQIQSICRLERHTAEALGYHNLYDYE